MITSAGTVKSSSGATVRLRQNTDCTTENVVYLITCSKQYVGETKGPLNKRMNGHREDWRHRRFERSPTAEHFHSADHDFFSHASVCCLEHNKEWSDSTRKLRESYWIRPLNTLTDSIWSYGRAPGKLSCCGQSFGSLDMFYTSVLLKFSYKTFLARMPVLHSVARMNILCAVFNSEILYSHICENPRIRLGPFLRK